MESKEVTMQEVYLKNFIEDLRPRDLEIRKQLDFGFSWKNNTVILFEIRPRWNNPQEMMENEFAKIKFVKSSNEWKLYWLRSSGKWESYEPFPSADNLQQILDIIKEDANSNFFG